MKHKFAYQLNGADLGRKVRIKVGTDAAVEDVIAEVYHERVGGTKVTYVRLATVSAPPSGAFQLTGAGSRNGWFRFSAAQEIEVQE